MIMMTSLPRDKIAPEMLISNENQFFSFSYSTICWLSIHLTFVAADDRIILCCLYHRAVSVGTDKMELYFGTGERIMSYFKN